MTTMVKNVSFVKTCHQPRTGMTRDGVAAGSCKSYFSIRSFLYTYILSGCRVSRPYYSDIAIQRDESTIYIYKYSAGQEWFPLERR